LSPLNTSSSGDENEEKRQAFFAGGFGVTTKKSNQRLRQRRVQQAQSENMEKFDLSELNVRSFSGIGYRLGETNVIQ
jgi:hypothetical protein